MLLFVLSGIASRDSGWLGLGPVCTRTVTVRDVFDAVVLVEVVLAAHATVF